MKRITLELPDNQAEEYTQLAAKLGISRNAYLSTCLRLFHHPMPSIQDSRTNPINEQEFQRKMHDLTEKQDEILQEISMINEQGLKFYADIPEKEKIQERILKILTTSPISELLIASSMDPPEDPEYIFPILCHMERMGIIKQNKKGKWSLK